MIIVDTSTWVDHIRGLSTPIEQLLGHGHIALHPFVFGELLLNGLPKSGPFSAVAFSTFATPPLATPSEISAFIQWAKLAEKGMGYVDTHLLLSARYANGKLLTSDSNLKAQAENLGLAYNA